MKSLSVKLGVILFIGFAIFDNADVWGADWKVYGRIDKGSFFYDEKSIRHPSENIVEVLEKQDYTEEGVNDMVERVGEKYKNVSHLITLWQINCANKKFHFLSLTYYSKEGKVIYSWEVIHSSFGPPEEWTPFITDSLGERLFKAVCK